MKDTDFIESIYSRVDPTIRPAQARLKNKSSKWRVVSALQKAIRRGLTEQAILTTSALINSGETSYVMRRLGVIALEDIAFGDLNLIADLLAFCGSKKVRDSLSDLTLLSLVKDLCEVERRDRSFCEFIVLCMNALQFKEMRDLHMTLPDTELIQLAATSEDPYERCIAASALGGVLNDGGDYKVRKYGDKNLKFWKELHVRDTVSGYIASKSLAMGGELHGFATAMRVLEEMHSDEYEWIVEPQEEPPTIYINGLVSTAFDQHCFEGKRVIAYFKKACQPVAEFLEAHPEAPSHLINDVIFHVEGKWCKDRGWTSITKKVERDSQLQCAERCGLSPGEWDEISSIVGNSINQLNDIRKKLVG